MSRYSNDSSMWGELFGMFVFVVALIVVSALAGHWFEKGHWEETGRIVPESTTFIPIKVGENSWMPMPITTPAHPEKVWIPEKESAAK